MMPVGCVDVGSEEVKMEEKMTSGMLHVPWNQVPRVFVTNLLPAHLAVYPDGAVELPLQLGSGN